MVARLLTFLSFLLGAIVPSHSLVSHEASNSLSPLLLVDLKSGSYCTAFPVSSDGYLMTAAHCLKRCLKEATDHGTADSELPCSGYALPGLKTSWIKIVAKGLAMTGTKKVETRFGDYAILKVEAAEPLSCLALSADPVSAGDTLKVVGYPLPKKAGERPVLGSNIGTLYGDASESHYYRTRKTTRERKEILDLYDSKDGVLYSSAHHSAGQSGGPVLDKSGRVVGVVSGFTVTRAGRIVVHEMVAGSTAKILASLPASLSNELVKKSRDCGATRL